ncbi:MAG TPA: DUF5683 domain-containing protein [Longimicrobiales bacterium]|nr:DUF5683 domain-containing protein [Longimicrobiales bacterium]
MKALLIALSLLCASQPLFAQDTTAVADSAARRFSPGKALLRSLIFPGWGQFSVGAYKRGTFFLLAQGSSYYMLARTHSRLNKAEDKLDTRITTVRDSLTALGDTVDLETRLDTMSTITPERSLVSSRKRHMQDWITYTIFFTLASGVDAFVAAHLADFPARVGTERQPDGSTELKVSIPLPSRRQH